MGFLDIMGLKKIVDDVPKLEPTPVASEEKETPKDTDYYRVGVTINGHTTLTLKNDNYGSITLTMNRASCEQLIKMLKSTFTTESNNETSNS
jgi:hypothetical protein